MSAEPTVAGARVPPLTVDGSPLEALTANGSSELSLEVSSNSTETRYGNYEELARFAARLQILPLSKAGS